MGWFSAVFERHPRRTVVGAIAVAVAIAIATALLVGMQFAEAQLSGSNFEIEDGNMVLNGAAPAIDWGSVSEIRKTDTTSGSGDESFGNGTKEDTASPSVVDGGIPPNKSDLKTFGVYQEGSGGSGFLNMFWQRVQDPSGTTNMDFEFNQRQCTPGQTPADTDCTANGITPIRSVDDLLVTYDLSRGGTVPTLSIREWDGSKWGAPTDLSASDKAAGSINGSSITDPDANNASLDPRTFGEAQLDLAAIFGSTECRSFGSAYLKSRSSDSFTSALKDFVPPVAVNISNCGSLKINKTDDATPGSPLNGAVFTLYKDVAPLNNAGGPGTEDKTAANTVGTCTTAAGTCTFSNLLIGNYWVVETTPPPGYTKPTPDYQHVEIVTADTQVTKSFVDVLQKVPSTLTSAQTLTPQDSATITWADGGTPTGTVSFYLYGPGDECTGTPVYKEENVSLSVSKTANTTFAVTAADADTYKWLVKYTPATETPQVHQGVTSACGEENFTATIDNGGSTTTPSS